MQKKHKKYNKEKSCGIGHIPNTTDIDASILGFSVFNCVLMLSLLFLLVDLKFGFC